MNDRAVMGVHSRRCARGVEDLPLLVSQVTFMAHSCVDAVKQSAHQRQPDQAS
jgi:hypothetical protein